MTRDAARVLSERSTVPLEQLYAEAPERVRGVIDVMPIGVLRRKLAAAEVELSAMRDARAREVKFLDERARIARAEESRVLAARLQRALRRVSELEEINKDQARMLARQRERKSA